MTAANPSSRGTMALEEALKPLDQWGSTWEDCTLLTRQLEHRMPTLKAGPYQRRAGRMILGGELAGLPFVFRLQRGRYSLLVGGTPLEEPLYEAYCPREKSGVPTDEELAATLPTLASNLKRAVFPYQFIGNEIRLKGKLKNIKFEVTGKEQIFYARGRDPEDAFRKISEPAAVLVSLGVSEAVQRQLFKLQEVNPIPLNRDSRSFPTPDPTFVLPD